MELVLLLVLAVFALGVKLLKESVKAWLWKKIFGSKKK